MFDAVSDKFKIMIGKNTVYCKLGHIIYYPHYQTDKTKTLQNDKIIRT